ncbi:MAG: Smr/MutS family protein [Bacteroidales bacterium]|nr:Smr/MutS family protein [Bacteroidales bacterium]MDZ4204635.1 Smr/MutS family protein [Bacteroidales bacterium]
MIYPKNFEEKTGFTVVRTLIAKYMLCPLGMQQLTAMEFITDPDQLKDLLVKVHEMKGILKSGLHFPDQDYIDLTSLLAHLRTQGTFIEPGSMGELRASLEAINEVTKFINCQSADKTNHLRNLVSTVYVEPSIIREIHRIVDEKGRIRDGASPQLKELRGRLLAKHTEIDRKLANILAQVKKEGWTAGDVEIAIRNGRQVIPMPASYKRKIRGFVHDESATGQTVYIEPDEIFDINNEIRELQGEERREIIKILLAFTDELRPNIDMLLHAYHVLGEVDFIRAKAKFAIEINANLPNLRDEALTDWINAIHPLLYLSHKEQKKSVVPLNLKLDRTERILMISGPNAGGKSVALKTTGLLQYMLQCGLLIPVDEQSQAGIFDKLFIDIGDEQSLEHDLSTYTSHLTNLKFFIENADPNTLVMIDEFGTGTEPQLGGAIAEATLEHLSQRGCMGVITTHYANLKEASGRIAGLLNGAMLFDPKTLSPLYILKTGKPGSSFAFEIAAKIGFPPNVLEQAATKTGTPSINYDRLLQELESEKLAISIQSRSVKVADEFLNELIQRYQRMHDELKREKQAILQKARQEALDIVRRSNQLIEKTVREIKESQANKQKVMELRQEVEKLKDEISSEEVEQTQESQAEEPDVDQNELRIEIGAFVRIKDQNAVGKIIEIRDHEVLIEAGNIILHVHADKLLKASAKDKAKAPIPITGGNKGTVYHGLSDRIANFKLSIDLRGKKADEVSQILVKYIDDAILLNIPEITILHGKGDGVLRQVVRDYLNSVPEAKSISEGHPDRGGSGLTIVSFR